MGKEDEKWVMLYYSYIAALSGLPPKTTASENYCSNFVAFSVILA